MDANPATKAAITGTELFTREVVRRLAGAAPEIDWRFYSARPGDGLGVDLTVLPFPRLWAQGRLPIELARSRPALFLDLAHVVPAICPVPAIKVFHDLAFERFPGAYGRAQLLYLRTTTRSAAQRCRTMIAVSEATRQDLISLYGVAPDRVVVVHEGGGEASSAPATVNDPARLAELGIERPFALTVGRIEQRKNQLAALAAVERAGGLQLVCAGAVHDRGMAARLEASALCRVLGRVTDSDRELLYRTAQTLLFPSLYEGFGIPILEAMRAGLPVVTSRRSSLPEVAGEAALYVADPSDGQALAAQLERLRDDAGLRDRLSAAGRSRAAGFSWDRCAAGIAAVVRERLSLGAPARSEPPPSPR